MTKNTTPQLTDEQRRAATQKAVAARRERADALQSLREGKLTIEELVNTNSPALKRMKINSLLRAIPLIGKVRAAKIMEDFGIAANRRIGGLGQKQREKIITYFFDKRCEEHPQKGNRNVRVGHTQS